MKIFSLKEMFCLGSFLHLKQVFHKQTYIFTIFLSSAFYAWMFLNAQVLVTTLFLLRRQG